MVEDCFRIVQAHGVLAFLSFPEEDESEPEQQEPEPEQKPELLSQGVPCDLYHADGTPDYG